MFNINRFQFNLIRSLWNDAVSCSGIRGISHSAPLAFNSSPVLMAMPVKRKRRMDPQLIRMREERKKRKLEKEIRALERMKKIMRPIEEARMPPVLHTEMEVRKRLVHVPESVVEDRTLLEKEWTRYKLKQTKNDAWNIHRILKSQERALDELRKESIDLYNAAIQIDENLLPFTYTGPSDTPPLQGYKRPDGDYIDISRNWFEDSKQKK